MKKDILINAVGIGGGQLVVLVATPFLTRIYSPAEFGVYAAMVAFAGIIATVASLRFDVAIPAVQDGDVKPLFHIAFALTFLVSVGVVAVLGLLSACVDVVAEMVAVPLPWVAVIAALLGATNVCQAQFTRRGDFLWVAALKVLQPVMFASVALTAVVGLSGALLVSWLLVLFCALWGCRHVFSAFDLGQSWAAVRNACKYPLLSAPMALLDTASLALPLLFIVAAFGNESAGNYSQVQRLLAAPLILLGIAAAQVFYKHAGDLHRGGRAVEPLLWRLVLTLLGLAILLVITTCLIGEPVMRLLLGEGWRTDLLFLLLAIAPMVFRMVVSPVSSVFLITDRLGLGSIWQASYFVVTVLVILVAHGRLGLEGYLLALACAELTMYLLYLILAVVAVRTDWSRSGAGAN